MASFFPDSTSFTSWLALKTEAELKTRLYRANPTGARLDGSKSVLVRRLEEITRHLTRERQLIIFPELRRRQSMIRATTANRTVLREVISSSNRPTINTRPVPNFNSQLPSRRLTIPVSPLLGIRRSRQHPEVAMTPVTSRARNRPPRNILSGVDRTPEQMLRETSRRLANPVSPLLGIRRSRQHPEVDMTHVTVRARNPPRNILSGVDRTPEQMLREALELQAGMIIQSISQAVTPRTRQHSISSIGAVTPVNSRRRAASTSSAEKRGPEVVMEEDVKMKLECKICFDSRINTVLLPCGHACSCQDCSVKLKFATWDSKCPICRSRIQNISMLYFS